jgi:hypothetical protein
MPMAATQVVCVLKVAEAEFLIAAQAPMPIAVFYQAVFIALWDWTAAAA